MNKPGPDLSSLLPDDAVLKERRAALIDAVRGSKSATTAAWRSGSRLALASAAGLAIVLAGILALNSGPTTQPAAAEALHETAAIAASGEGVPTLQAGPGQYYFTKMKTLEFEGWVPGGVTANTPITSMPGGFSALIPMDSEYWMSPEGGGRRRQTMGTPRFFSNSEQSRWEEAGSPLSIGFDTRHEDVRQLEEAGGGHVLETSRGVLDVETPTPNGGSGAETYFPDLSNLPTDPEELRLAIQNRQAFGTDSEPGKPLDTHETIEALGGILTPTYPNASPALRAAAFNALAELPGVELDRNATDLIGRAGYAISYAKGHGLRGQFIFDPETSMSLGERTVLADPGQEPQWKGYQAGLTVRDVAYLQSKVVDSTREPAEKG